MIMCDDYVCVTTGYKNAVLDMAPRVCLYVSVHCSRCYLMCVTLFTVLSFSFTV